MLKRNVKDIPGIDTTEVVSNWDQLIGLCSDRGFNDIGNKWIYRGQESVDWELKSTFERAKEDINDEPPCWKYEAAILREFTRRAHHYVSDLPKPTDILEWFSLMRHYGAPCRLVDFTYSFYVATYFALKRVTKENKISALWAIKQSLLKEKFRRVFPNEDRSEGFRFKEPADFYSHFLDYQNPKDFIAPVNPFRMNQRLAAQQGVFLCPGNIAESFMHNLLANGKKEDKNDIVRIPLSFSLKTEAIRRLWRMNINSATLFPDLTGFAEYLSDWFHLPLDFNESDLTAAIEGRFPGEG
jgi:hypothetical protein